MSLIWLKKILHYGIGTGSQVLEKKKFGRPPAERRGESG